MNHRELTAFLTTAAKGSFMKAARELHISAVSIMNQVNSLENFVGAKLLERTPQGAKLTAAGQSFQDDARQILALTHSAVQKARKLSKSEQSIIRVGTSILRPCKILLDLSKEFNSGTPPFQIRIVPFDDAPASLDTLLFSHESGIDCFVSPCDSIEWSQKYNILLLDTLPCRVAVPRGHRLAAKTRLTWTDLENEKFMLIRRGDSPVLNSMRDEFIREHPSIEIIDIPNRYDTSIFNECERMNCLMETLDIWADVHPSLLTLPMEWRYKMPYGIIYAKEPTEAVKVLMSTVSRRVTSLSCSAQK